MAEYMPDPWRLRAPFSASPTGALPPTPSRRSLSHADIVPFRERLRTARLLTADELASVAIGRWLWKSSERGEDG